MNKAEFYKVLAVALAVVISWAAFYGYYVSTQPYRKLPEQPFRPYQVEGIISVYKNGILVHQGPDVLTNSFYQYLPFLLGDVCALATNDAPTSCPAGSWPDTVFTAAPPALSCSVSISPTSVTAASSRVPVSGAASGQVKINIGQAGSASPTDCVLAFVAQATATVNVYSPFTNNPNNPPAPCPNPTQGCVQISASFTNFPSAMTLSDAMLYTPYSVAGGSLLYTLIAHDIFASVSVNPQDTLTVVYTFIFPGVQTNAGAYSQDQGAIAALFGQCLSRQHFGIGSGSNRLCLDSTLPSSAKITVSIPASPCSDSQGPSGTTVDNGNNKITIETSAASKFVKIYAPMASAGSGIQKVTYHFILTGPIFIYPLIATQTCAVATQQSFQQGQTVGLQLTFP